jgi:hypothetical protein
MAESTPQEPEPEPDLAPVDYVILEFDSLEPTGEGLDVLLDLVERGIIRILDFQVLKRNADGTVVGLKAEDVSGTGVGSVDVFIASSSGLLTQDDYDAAAAILQPGSTAVALLYENTWAIPFVRSVRNRGGRVVTSRRVSVDDILAALRTAGAERETADQAP